MSSSGAEMILGARRDPDWGPVLVVGLGGIWTEALNDVRLVPASATAEEILDEIRQLKGARILAGWRGSPPFDVAAAAQIAATLGGLMLGNPDINEIEINPLALRAIGEGAVALDALMIVKDRT